MVIPNPPVLISAQFGDSGSFIDVFFDKTTNKGGSLGVSGDCTALFANATAKFGAGNKCTWVDGKHITVTLGQSTNITIGVLLSVLPIIYDISGLGNPANSTPVAVAAPAHPVRPVIVIDYPLTVQVCTSFVLDATYSIGAGGRSWKQIDWILSGYPPNTNVTTLSQKVRTTKSLSLSLTGVELKPTTYPGFYNFTLLLTNWLNETSSSTITVASRNDTFPVPQARSLTPVVSTTRPKGVWLHVEAQTSFCSHTNYTATLTYSWYNGNTSNPLPNNPTSASKSLYLPPNSLSPNVSYTFHCYVFQSTDIFPDLTHTDVAVVVQVGSSDLVPALDSGDITVSTASTFTLSGLPSYDPDNTTTPLQFLWSCTPFCDQYINNKTLGHITVSQLPVGVKVFTLTVSKPGRLSQQTSINVESVVGSPPIVRIQSSLGLTISAQKRLVLTSTITPTTASNVTTPFSYQWSVTGDLDIPLSQNFATDLHSNTLVVKTGKLKAGTSYVFQLTVTHPQLETGTGRLTIQVGAPPSGGDLQVSGPDANKKYNVSLLGWTSFLGTSLTYTFQIKQLSSGATLGLGLPSTTSTLTSLTFPSGANTIIGTVQDAIGFATVVTYNITVPTEVLTNYNNTALNQKIDEVAADYLDAFVVDYIQTVHTLQYIPDAAQRLAGRQRLLQILKARFAVTPLTPLNIKSFTGCLLAVLENNTDSLGQQSVQDIIDILGYIKNGVRQENLVFDDFDVTQGLINTIGKIGVQMQLLARNQFKSLVNTFDQVVQDTIKVIIGAMVVGEDPVVLSSGGESNPTATLTKYDATQMVIQNVSTASNDVQVSLPSDVLSGQNNTSTSSGVAVSMIVWPSNPFPVNGTDIVGAVVSISLVANNQVLDVHNLTTPITITLPLSPDALQQARAANGNSTSYLFNCVFFNLDTLRWSGDGCTRKSYDNTSVTCECTHLTEFSVQTDFSVAPQQQPAGSASAASGSPIVVFIAIGVTAGIVIIVVIIILVLVRRRKQQRLHQTQAPQQQQQPAQQGQQQHQDTPELSEVTVASKTPPHSPTPPPKATSRASTPPVPTPPRVATPVTKTPPRTPTPVQPPRTPTPTAVRAEANIDTNNNNDEVKRPRTPSPTPATLVETQVTPIETLAGSEEEDNKKAPTSKPPVASIPRRKKTKAAVKSRVPSEEEVSASRRSTVGSLPSIHDHTSEEDHNTAPAHPHSAAITRRASMRSELNLVRKKEGDVAMQAYVQAQTQKQERLQMLVKAMESNPPPQATTNQPIPTGYTSKHVAAASVIQRTYRRHIIRSVMFAERSLSELLEEIDHLLSQQY